MGNVNPATRPANTMTIDITVEKTGRSTKNSTTTAVPSLRRTSFTGLSIAPKSDLQQTEHDDSPCNSTYQRSPANLHNSERTKKKADDCTEQTTGNYRPDAANSGPVEEFRFA